MVERSACVTDARGAEATLTQARPGPPARGVADASRRRGALLPRPRRATTTGPRVERAANGILDGLGRVRPRSTRRARWRPPDRPGRVLAGTSGFAYPGWAPRFYPAALKSADLLPHYAARLPAVELNNTFYARPTAAEDRGVGAARRRPGSGSSSRRSAARASGRCSATPPSPCPGSRSRCRGSASGWARSCSASTPRPPATTSASPGCWPRGRRRSRSWSRRSTRRGTSTRRSPRSGRRTPSCARPTRRRGGSARHPAHRPVPVPAAAPGTTYDDAALDAWAARLVPFLDDGAGRVRPVPARRGRRRAPSTPRGSPARVERARPRADGYAGEAQPARDPSAGPKTTIRWSSSAMSWNRCGSWAGTNRSVAGPDSRVSCPR